MEPVKIMVCGLPGNVAQVISRGVLSDNRFELLPHSLTGPGIAQGAHMESDALIRLHLPEAHGQALDLVREAAGEFFIIDYTHPTAVNANAQLYCEKGIPFVMGTTGGDRQELVRCVEASQTSAVIAPNMAKQIVGFTAMMQYMAENFPGLFSGYTLTITESHQQGKADTSGTAKSMVQYFNEMGVPFTTDQIRMIRDPEEQKEMGVPESYLGGHGWHTYTLVSEDKTVLFEFKHNVNGREIYWGGTADAALFLAGQIRSGSKGRVFSMIEALKG